MYTLNKSKRVFELTIYVWLLLGNGAGRSRVGSSSSSSFLFLSATRLRSSIQTPLAPPHRHRRCRHSLCIFPATFLLPVSPLQPLQERLEAASWIAARKGARQTFKKKKKTSKLRERFQLARRIDRNSLSPPLHSCIFPHGKREKKNNKNLRAKSLSATLVPASFSASAEHELFF